jgi:mannose-6-phosphate isomerase-like protein (cupin superfamily)
LVAVIGLVGAVNFALQPGGRKQMRRRSFFHGSTSRQPAGQKYGPPDEVRSFDKGRMDVVTLDNVTVGKATFEPGWRWSEAVKPIAGTDSCQVPHVGYVISGRMKVVMDDGAEMECGPNDALVIPPGHDAWIVGDEPCVILDFAGADEYAKGARS